MSENKNKALKHQRIKEELKEFSNQSEYLYAQFKSEHDRNELKKYDKYNLQSQIVDLNRQLTENLFLNKIENTKNYKSEDLNAKKGSSYTTELTASAKFLTKFDVDFNYTSDSNEIGPFEQSIESVATIASTPSQLTSVSNTPVSSDFQDTSSETSDFEVYNGEDIQDAKKQTSNSQILDGFNKVGKIFTKRLAGSVKIKTKNTDETRLSEMFSFLPSGEDTECSSMTSYELLSKSEAMYLDYTVHMREFKHTSLEEQSYKCAGCNSNIKYFIKAKRCFYYGKLYCKLCHLRHKFYIPAKIIKNLEAKKYPVCEDARYTLEKIFKQPIFDIIYDNSELYVKSNLLNECRKIRLELEHLRWYLQTCQNINAKNTFIMYLWPDDYLFETIHLYSLFDLTNLKDVYNKLKSARDFGVGHVLKECDLCVQKGFICEICKSDETIYPFQLDNVVQCPECGALSHKTCHATSNSCLKCQRLAENN